MHIVPLLLAAAAVSGVLAIGSLILWLTGRKK
jgi:hypothetical protein